MMSAALARVDAVRHGRRVAFAHEARAELIHDTETAVQVGAVAGTLAGR